MRGPSRSGFLASVATLLSAWPALAQPIALPPDACGRLTSASVPRTAIALPSGGATIDRAEAQAAMPIAVAERAPTPAARITPAAPAFCRVLGRIAPADPAAPPIRFQVNLPASWNGKLVQFGGGGFNGVLITGLGLVPGAPFDAPGPLAEGYVTYGTDSGHEQKPGEPPQAFAANDEAFLNFAHAGYKKVRDAAVALTEQAYGRRPARIYFVGSSEGGREALTMAQRYPADFDGVFARVPVINWTGLQHAGSRNGLATRGDGWLARAQVELVHDAVLAACDGADGVTDGLVANPRKCLAGFRAADLRCPDGQAAGACLNADQVRAVETLHAPYVHPFPLANGVTEYPGWGISGEGLPAAGPTGGWSAWWVGASPPAVPPRPDNGIAWVYGSGALTHIFARDPASDPSAYRPEAHRARVEEVSALMDSTSPDLSAFAARGGKVIILEHMADYAQSPFAGIRYYDSVVDRMGRDRAASLVRLFTLPGIDHVGTGGPANVDMLGALDHWVEGGAAPAGLVATEQEVAPSTFLTRRSMPLCEWPAWPKYRSGDQSAAASFSCVSE